MSQESIDANERKEIIDKISKTGNSEYCSVRMILQRMKLDVCPCSYENGCGGDHPCQNKATLYESDITLFTMDQSVEVEKMKYLDSMDGRERTWNEAAFHWADRREGGAAVFRYAFEELGIHDPERLEALCVHSARDAKPILK